MKVTIRVTRDFKGLGMRVDRPHHSIANHNMSVLTCGVRAHATIRLTYDFKRLGMMGLIRTRTHKCHKKILFTAT